MNFVKGIEVVNIPAPFCDFHGTQHCDGSGWIDSIEIDGGCFCGRLLNYFNGGPLAARRIVA